MLCGILSTVLRVELNELSVQDCLTSSLPLGGNQQSATRRGLQSSFVVHRSSFSSTIGQKERERQTGARMGIKGASPSLVSVILLRAYKIVEKQLLTDGVRSSGDAPKQV